MAEERWNGWLVAAKEPEPPSITVARGQLEKLMILTRIWQVVEITTLKQ